PTLSELFSSFLRGASCLKSPRTRSKEQRTTKSKPKVISRDVPASRRTFPAGQVGPFASRVRRLSRSRRIVMLPAIVTIRHKDIVENHRAQPQHDQVPDIADVEGRIETIVFQALPVVSILIPKRRDVVSKNVAQEPQLEAFV